MQDAVAVVLCRIYFMRLLQALLVAVLAFDVTERYHESTHPWWQQSGG